jgi:prepilin-type N-terminal cleavage/methylation domain-containing protein
MKKHNNKGFSLIELIIAIAILVILTGLLAPQFMRYIEKSREAKDVQTLDTVYEAVQAALADEKAYVAALTHEDLNDTAKGEALSDLLGDADDFEKELKANLGGVSDLELVSKKAKTFSADSKTGAIYVVLDSNSRVGVFYSNAAGGKSTESDFNLGIAK